ncbi:MAG TPA: hypothetical protein DHV62_09605 [Elusimicrobia bacterium]|nr:hypothetical protein [Elusimicrobiota bacterium]
MTKEKTQSEIHEDIKKMAPEKTESIKKMADSKEKQIKAAVLLNNAVAIANTLYGEGRATFEESKMHFENIRNIAQILEKMMDTEFKVSVETLIKTLSNEDQQKYKTKEIPF